jgi:peptidoglycan/xylan/chitin deacetylase (PgdA/CDA1 family)/glycosyltransferase involved in cell wall biosynthesis
MARVSVIVPAFNEEELLPQCLAALMAQARETAAEIIVVDNASTDRTAAIAREFGATVVHEPQRGYVHALARGVQAASHPLVAVTDADSVVGPRWLAGIQAALARPDIAGVTGPVAYEGSRSLTWMAMLMPHELWGANMAFRKADLEAVGGIDPRINMGADIHLNAQLRRRGRIIFDRQVRVTTSSRRFVAQPVRQTLRFTLNYFWLKLFGRSLFWDFTAIRDPSPELAGRSRRRRATLTCGVASIFALYLAVWPSSSVFGEVVRPHVAKKLIALTFDDGPNGAPTRAIVDILQARGATATFFEIGSRVAADPGTVRYVSDHGFPIGNHSWDHSLLLPLRGVPRLEREIVSTSDVIANATGVAPRYFRPPHGWRSPQLLLAARREHLQLIDWSVDPADYLTNDPERIARRVVNHARPGSIILLHDGLADGLRAAGRRGREGTIAALPLIIDELRRGGYTFVTMEELLAERDLERSGTVTRLQRLHDRAGDLVHGRFHRPPRKTVGL